MSQKKKTNRMGRPPKDPKEKLNYRVTVRLTSAQHKRVLSEAKKAGLSISAFFAKLLER